MLSAVNSFKELCFEKVEIVARSDFKQASSHSVQWDPLGLLICFLVECGWRASVHWGFILPPHHHLLPPSHPRAASLCCGIILLLLKVSHLGTASSWLLNNSFAFEQDSRPVLNMFCLEFRIEQSLSKGEYTRRRINSTLVSSHIYLTFI